MGTQPRASQLHEFDGIQAVQWGAEVPEARDALHHLQHTGGGPPGCELSDEK